MGNRNKNRHRFAWIKHADFIFIDILCLLLSFYIAFHIYFGHPTFDLPMDWNVFLLILVLVDFTVILVSSPFSGILREPGYSIPLKVFSNAFLVTVSIFITFYVLKIGSSYSRVTIAITMILYFIIASVAEYFWRLYLLKCRKKYLAVNSKKLVLVMDKLLSDTYIDEVLIGDSNEYVIDAVFFVNENIPERMPESKYDIKSVTGEKEWREYAVSHGVDAVFVAFSEHIPATSNLKELMDCDIDVFFDIAKIAGSNTEVQSVEKVGLFNVLAVRSHEFTPQQRAYLYAKRVFDICIGAVGSIVMVVFAFIIKICYLCTGDKGPVFYTQIRVGKNGKTFKMYKFRSMVTNADEVLEELLKIPAYKEEWTKNNKFDNDPRITKVGGWIRKSSLDELPQFINLLNGTMSLIGPRPLVIGEREAHGGLAIYEEIKPGITGWWACNGRSNIEYNERLEMEYAYVKNVSFILDFICLLRTIKIVVQKNGAK